MDHTSDQGEPSHADISMVQRDILESLDNLDYLLVIASQQNKSVERVRYELLLKLAGRRNPI